MAQKKVILKDGQDELMPKTLASMVFTSDGTSVEAALENIGGGGSGGGTGNVKVTNASGLVSSNYYAFKPSADGSVEGTFSTIPGANEDRSGLMSAADKAKLDDIKPLLKFPLAVASLTASSSSDEILQALGGDFSSTSMSLLMLMGFYQETQAGEYDTDLPEAYIGNYRADMFCTFDSEAYSGTMELTYVAAGGKLRTITISGKQGGTSPDFTYTYSCAVTESGDDTYYLPIDVSTLNAGATAETIKDAFGGEEIFMEAVNAASNRKKLYIYGPLLWLIPVSASCPFGVTGFFAFLHVESERTVIKHISSSTVRCFYPSGYSLKPELYALTSSSTSDEISTAVGGESGLKAIIQALKDGNRLKGKYVIPDSNPSISVELTVTNSAYVEGDNGDLLLLLGSEAFVVTGFTRIGIAINYTKSSNTFSCGVVTD